MNVNDAIARILKSEGVEWVTCFPSNNLIESCAVEGIRSIMFRHERGAIMAADGYSRMSNRKSFGTVITQGGPGAENSMGGIAQAFSDNVPILVFQGGPSLQQYPVRPNFSPVRTYETVTRYGEVILSPSQVGSAMRRAFHALRNGRPGPVIVEVPSDVSTQEVPEGGAGLQLAKALPLRSVQGRRQGRGEAPPERKAAYDPFGYGRTVRRGHRGAEGAGGAGGHPRLLHHARQVVLRRAPSPLSGLGQRRDDRAGPPVARGVGRAVRRGLQHDQDLLRPDHPREQGDHPQLGERRGDQQGLHGGRRASRRRQADAAGDDR